MSCLRCGGNLLGKGDDCYCLQCGWRPGSEILQRIERKSNRVMAVSVVPLEGLVEEYLNETNDATQKAKRLLSDKKGLVKILEHFWHQHNLAQRFTLQHLALLECFSILDEELDNKLEQLESFKVLRHFRLDGVLGTSHRPTGGRPTSTKVIDLALKMVLCASYQWLRTVEVEREIAKSMSAERKKARAAAYMSVKNAHRLSRRILFRLGPDIDLVHTILTRALWEEKYQPVVITVDGYISDVTY